MSKQYNLVSAIISYFGEILAAKKLNGEIN